MSVATCSCIPNRKLNPMHYYWSAWAMLLLAVTGRTASVANAHTAVIFGASGTVGSEVLQALLHQDASNAASSPFWENVIVVGRRRLNVDMDIDMDVDVPTKVREIVVADLMNMDQNEELQQLRAERTDACFIAVGAGAPHTLSLRQWHAVDVGIPAAVVRLCESMQARLIALLSSIDAQDDPEPFPSFTTTSTITSTTASTTASTPPESHPGDHGVHHNRDAPAAQVPVGWWGILLHNARMKGLAQRALASATISHVRIFQSSNIRTDHTRYGWFDWALFKLLPFIDPLLPAQYKSIHVRSLGRAMAADAAQLLQNTSNPPQSANTSTSAASTAMKRGVTYLTYADFIRTLQVDDAGGKMSTTTMAAGEEESDIIHKGDVTNEL